VTELRPRTAQNPFKKQLFPEPVHAGMQPLILLNLEPGLYRGFWNRQGLGYMQCEKRGFAGYFSD
jgi:hypothetical protein